MAKQKKKFFVTTSIFYDLRIRFFKRKNSNFFERKLQIMLFSIEKFTT